MGGLGPGIGGGEIFVIGLVALLVVGPQRLPLLMRKVGQAMAKARNMANEFRASFDEMARQSELDELRKEVEALRRTQMVPLGAEAEAAFRDINAEMNRPLAAPPPAPTPQLEAPEPEPVVAPATRRAPRAKAATKAAPKKTTSAKAGAKKAAPARKTAPRKKAAT